MFKKFLTDEKNHNSYNISHVASYLTCLIFYRRKSYLDFFQKGPEGFVRENKRFIKKKILTEILVLKTTISTTGSIGEVVL